MPTLVAQAALDKAGEWFGNGCEEAILAVAAEISQRQRATPHGEMGYRDAMTTLVWRVLNEGRAA